MERRTALRAFAAAGLGSALAACRAAGDGGPRAARPGSDAPRTPVPSPSSSGTALPFRLDSGPSDRPQVALTFHGQGDAGTTADLLREVEAAGARVTVLAVGTWLQEQPESARRVLDGGHELGNHTMHHGDISGMGPEAAYAEIAQCAQRLVRLAGSPGRWFRPSQAKDCTSLVAEQARRAGYDHCLGYDLDSLDHTDPGPEAVARTVLDGVRPGSVVSLHLGHRGTVAAMPQILDGLAARALRPVTASELLAP
ncbi:polysaccharide deacetylase family protein [Kitasatospora phosalacinea]|uniref:Polysaccharide deacetylase n=1 Tax=Kitasatospora phosalacinea TaxID=2065 RepID=A0A9W6UNR3_9ACTN|nr:polysaccharide deacetylase family protein [Kitasatospora phosalacinea]GLW55139.1 polysaccharide deacetylase [Kitasatospora phosalacinea]